MHCTKQSNANEQFSTSSTAHDRVNERHSDDKFSEKDLFYSKQV